MNLVRSGIVWLCQIGILGLGRFQIKQESKMSMHFRVKELKKTIYVEANVLSMYAQLPTHLMVSEKIF